MTSDVCMNEECEANCGKQEVIYANELYRVEKIILKTEAGDTFLYGVYHNEYDVLEAETPLLAKALLTCEELDVAVSSFYKDKGFEKSQTILT